MRARSLLRFLGRIVGLMSLAWIVYEFVRTGVIGLLWHSEAFDKVAVFTAFGLPVYLAGLCCVAIAWWLVQTAFLPPSPPLALRSAFAVYATTQFAKYLPGNVGHFVGRHVLLRRHGIKHHALLLATLIDAGCLLLAALMPAASALYVFLPMLPVRLHEWQVAAVEIAIVFTLYVSIQISRRHNGKIGRWIALHSPRRLCAVLPLQWMFFAFMTLALMLPAHALLPQGADLRLMLAIAATSWMAGFLVLGAPAGLGVREVVFVTLLKGHMSEPDILLLAGIFRLITFGGDVLLFVLGLAIGRGVSKTAMQAISKT